MVRVLLLVVVSVCALTACNKRLFVEAPQDCSATIPVDLDIPTSKAADILIVVDNSGSMQEEQDRLAQNFFNPACPLTDLTDIKPEFKNPAPSLYEPGGALENCGFIQLLAAFDNDFRVGVITTDMGNSDNRFGIAPDGWGFHPERGCLQPDGNPADPGVRKIISAQDLKDDDATNNDLAGRFASTLANIRTFGSPYERGLDAMATFLDPHADRAPGCDGDLAQFRRANAQLDVIFLSDENDCSHALATAPFDELAGEPGPGLFTTLNQSPGPETCYSKLDQLAPVKLYADALKHVDPSAKVVVVAGLVPDDGADDGFTAEGCLAGDPPTSTCFPSHGNSNDTQSGGQCADDTAGNRGGLACCVADSGSRYQDFANEFRAGQNKSFLVDSICSTRFRDTMLEAAAFFGSTRFVDLVEAPDNGIVEVAEAHQGHAEAPVKQITAESCPSTSGWYLEGDRRIVFCNDAIPEPGDKVSIRAKGHVATSECTPSR